MCSLDLLLGADSESAQGCLTFNSQNLPGIALRVPHDVIIGFIKVYRMITNIMIIYLIKIRRSACSSFLICRSVGYEQSPIANENGACDTTKVLLKCVYATSNRIGRKQVITVFIYHNIHDIRSLACDP